MAETFVWKTSTCFERLYQKKIFFYLLPSFWSIHRVRIVHVSGKETSQFCQAQNIEASFFRSLWCTCTLLLDFANIFVFLQKFKVSFITFQKSLYWMKLKNLSTVDVFWAKYLMKSLLRPFNFFQLLSISCHQPSFRRWQFTFGEEDHTKITPTSYYTKTFQS